MLDEPLKGSSFNFAKCLKYGMLTIVKYMKNTIEELDKLYKLLINHESDKFFYLGLADYIDYCLNNPDTAEIIKKGDKEITSAEKKLTKAKNDLEFECTKFFRKIYNGIKSGNIKADERILDAVKAFLFEANCLSESVQVSKSEKLYFSLEDLVLLLPKCNFKNEFYELTSYTDFELSTKNFKYKLNTGILSLKKQLFLVRDIIRQPKTAYRKLQKGEYDILGIDEHIFAGLLNELEKILGIESSTEFFKPYYFDRGHYIECLTRFHTHIIQKLINPDSKIKKVLKFLSAESKLLINQYTVENYYGYV
jgi:hypothetical protein